MEGRRSLSRHRQTKTSELVSITPAKRPPTSKAKKTPGTAKLPRGRPRKLEKQPERPIESKYEEVSSSSSSDDDSEDEYKHRSDDSENENDMEIDDYEDKENISILSECLTKSFSTLGNHKTTKSSSKKNTPIIRRRSARILGAETPTENKTKRNLGGKKVFESDSDENDFSDELGDSDIVEELIKDAQRCSGRTPLRAIETKRIGTIKSKTVVTPIRLKVGKTPGGTQTYKHKNRAGRRSGSDSDEIEESLKIKIKLPPKNPHTTIEKLKAFACKLHLSEVPTNLPCRENEAKQLRQFIEKAIHPTKGESSAMYVSGVPGTGKTATVRAVVNAMLNDRKVNSFVYVEVNAMIYRKKVFVEIYNGIQEKYAISKPKTAAAAAGKIAATTARQRLNTMFRKADKYRPPIVVLVDELDGLCNRKQDVLYDIFDWTSMAEARVTIIAIANTLDFPERMLCQRISSRLDKWRLIFHPYEHEQIEQIMNARLSGSDVIEPNAVKFVARKVSAISGDLRQALDMLRRSIKVAIEMKADTLTMNHVNLAQKAVSEPLKLRLIKGLRLHKFMLFRAVLTTIQETKQEETIFANAYKTYCVLCSTLSGLEPSSDGSAYEMLHQLARCSLVVLGTGQCGILRRKIKLGMSTCEAEKCVKHVIDMEKNI